MRNTSLTLLLTPLVEAKGWQRHDNGTVELIAMPRLRVNLWKPNCCSANP